MKAWAWVAAAFVLCAGQARAEDDQRWSLGVTEENDAWNFKGDESDRNYTQGLQIALMSPALSTRRLPALVRMTCFLEHGEEGCGGQTSDAKVRWGLELGQNIYTPTLRGPIPESTDRPYAGWLYGGAMFGSYSNLQANTLELQVGAVGPHAYAGDVQSYWHHHVLHIPRFEGWRHQLRDEVAFVALGERRWKPDLIWTPEGDRTGWRIDSPNYVDFAVGTLRDSVGAGRMLRFGYGLDSDFGPARIRPAPSGSVYIDPKTQVSLYAFAGVDGQAVARDLFLDGNTFRSSPSVKKRWFVGEGTMGAEFRFRGLRVAYTYVTRTEEFVSQRTPQHFTSLNVTWHGWWPLAR